MSEMHKSGNDNIAVPYMLDFVPDLLNMVL